jgi:hypothetical protein
MFRLLVITMIWCYIYGTVGKTFQEVKDGHVIWGRIAIQHIVDLGSIYLKQ